MNYIAHARTRRRPRQSEHRTQRLSTHGELPHKTCSPTAEIARARQPPSGTVHIPPVHSSINWRLALLQVPPRCTPGHYAGSSLLQEPPSLVCALALSARRFPLPWQRRYLRSMREPVLGSCFLHAGHRMLSILGCWPWAVLRLPAPAPPTEISICGPWGRQWPRLVFGELATRVRWLLNQRATNGQRVAPIEDGHRHAL